MNGYGGIGSHISNVSAIFTILFLIQYFDYLGKWENLVNLKSSADVALNVDTNKTQNLELLLDAADWAKFLAIEDFKHYSYTKLWDEKSQIGLDLDQWLQRCHLHTYRTSWCPTKVEISGTQQNF